MLVLVALAPAIVTVLLVHYRLDAHVRSFVPSFWNDQVGYWTRILSFSHHGFDTGYYAPAEQVPSKIDAIRFGVNGPWFPALYGTIGAIFGWHPYTSIFVNMAVLAVALAVFVWLARLDVRGTLLAGVAVLAVFPVLLYIPTASQESLQQGFAIVLAGIFVRAIRDGSALSRRERGVSIAFLLLCALTRFSWAVLLPALLLLYAPQVSWRRVGAAFALGLVAAVLVVQVTNVLQPPGNNSVSDRLTAVRQDPIDGTWTLLKGTWEDAKLFAYAGGLDPTAPPATTRGTFDHTNVQSWEIVGLIVLAVVVLARVRGPIGRMLAAQASREALFHLLNLGLMLVAALTLYLPNGYYRVLGAHLLLSALVLVGFRRTVPVAVIVGLSVLMLPSFLTSYSRWSPNFAFDLRALAHDRAAFARLMPYDANGSSPWCNTMLVPVDVYDWRVTLVPAGIGVAYTLFAPLPEPPKSRYVLLPDANTTLNRDVDTSRLRRLGHFAAGTLYENPHGECRA